MAATTNRKGCDCGTQPNRQYWLNVDGCGLFCAFVVYFLVSFGMYATTYAVIYPIFGTHSLLGGVHIVIFNSLSVLAIYCHLKAMTTDPGAILASSHIHSLIHLFTHRFTYLLSQSQGAVPPYAVPLSNDDEENDLESNVLDDRDAIDNHNEARERFDSIGSITSVEMNIMNDKIKNKSSKIGVFLSLLLIHSLTLTHSLTYSLTHSLTHSLTYSLTHSFTLSLTHSCIYSQSTLILINTKNIALSAKHSSQVEPTIVVHVDAA